MIELKRLSEVKKSDVIDLMNHPKVRNHMPLARRVFDDAAYDAFIAAKDELVNDNYKLTETTTIF